MAKKTGFIIAAIFVLAGVLGSQNTEKKQTYTNPVINEIGPADPCVIFHKGKYYLYPTGDNRSYHVYTSSDLVHWAAGRQG